MFLVEFTLWYFACFVWMLYLFYTLKFSFCFHQFLNIFSIYLCVQNGRAVLFLPRYLVYYVCCITGICTCDITIVFPSIYCILCKFTFSLHVQICREILILWQKIKQYCILDPFRNIFSGMYLIYGSVPTSLHSK